MQQKRSEREDLVVETRRVLEDALAKIGIYPRSPVVPNTSTASGARCSARMSISNRSTTFTVLRIIVETEAQCYAALGVVHSLWRPIPGEFDDYIASPKDNLYRSLHTAVLNNGRPIEVQIRTAEMNRVAELGIAAHWEYKEGERHDEDFNEKVAAIRQIMEWRQEVTDASEFMDGMKTDVFMDRVYVFTPKGDVVDLPAGATPIDLAYAIHTELGHRCRGANVNGRLGRIGPQTEERRPGRHHRRQTRRPQPRLAEPRPGIRRNPDAPAAKSAPGCASRTGMRISSAVAICWKRR